MTSALSKSHMEVSGSALDLHHLSELLATTGDRLVVLGGSKDPNAKVTVLLLDSHTGMPHQVIKVPTTDDAALAVARERGMLERLHEILPVELRATIPVPIGSVEFEGRRAMVASYVSGTPMSAGYHRHQHTARVPYVKWDLEAAGTWLFQLHLATAGEPSPIDLNNGLAERVVQRFYNESDAAVIGAEVAARCASLSRYQTPKTVVHGDFWFGNLLVSEQGVSGVIDWEHAHLVGEPIRDVVRFAISYALYLDRHTRLGRRVSGHGQLTAGRFGEGIVFGLFGSGWFPQLFRSFVAGALRPFGGGPELVTDAVLAGVAEVAADADDDDFARSNYELLQRLVGHALRGEGS